ncbi:hypothetical protein J4E80_005308 [Alternaria sp. BMP 0032]|nr:hypothetical protein J4E80_005308 [Alternaria sp. BMP 0032]
METIKEIVRDAPFGQLVRYATRNRFFKYPEELPGFEIPSAYTDVEKLPSHTAGAGGTSTRNSTSTTPLPSHALPFSPSRLEADLALHATHSPAHTIAPVKTADGLILAEWYTTTDTANPQNWSQGKKAWTAFLILPQLGRNIPYITTFALFTILTLPTALVDNLGGFLFLRFLLGFFGSPCLANGGATMQDLYSLLHIPYGLAFWTAAAFAGPALGPLLSGFSVYAENWRWSQWELLWMAAPVFLLFFFFLPETQPTTILLYRSARLRALTGNSNIHTQTEIDRKGTKFSAELLDTLIKPLEICVKDPALFFINVYSALTYGIYYSFFEVFPLVYLEIYGFSVGEMAIVFLSIIVGCVIAMTIYFSYLRFYLIPDILKRGLRPQEHRLVPAIFASFGVPIGLFIFGESDRTTGLETLGTNDETCRLDDSPVCTLDCFDYRYRYIFD